MQPFIVITIMQCMQFNERCSWAQSRNKRNPSAMHRPFRCVTFNIFVFVYILKCTLMCETSSLSFPRLEFACSQNWALRVGRFYFLVPAHAAACAHWHHIGGHRHSPHWPALHSLPPAGLGGLANRFVGAGALGTLCEQSTGSGHGRPA
jgi:hypothetical protein